MIAQHTHVKGKHKFEDVIRCMAVGQVKGSLFIAIGSHDRNLYILNTQLEIIQQMSYSSWVRCVATGDLDGDGEDEIVIGVGDDTLRVLHWVSPSDLQPEAVKVPPGDLSGWSLQEIFLHQFHHFVDSVAIGDLFGDGRMELVAGSWDQSVKAFTMEGACFRQLWSVAFSKSITNLIIADLIWDGKPEIIVLFKEGGAAAIHGENGYVYWMFETERELLCSAVGVLEESGYPVLVVTGNDRILYFLNSHGEVMHQKPLEDRVTSLLIGDIDGDHLNEILIAHPEALVAYKFTAPQISAIGEKWRYKIHHAVMNMQLIDVDKDDIPEVLFTGYSGIVTILQDAFFGEMAGFSITIPPKRQHSVRIPEGGISPESAVTASTDPVLFCDENAQEPPPKNTNSDAPFDSSSN